jgi:predicted ATPase
LVEYLNQKGFPVVKEIARNVLAEGILHPSIDQFAFQEEIAKRQLLEENKIRTSINEMAFLDRGLYDQIPFCRYFGINDLPPILNEKIHYDAVFILDPLPIFEKDGIRVEKDREEAMIIGEMIVKEYESRNVPCVHVPMMALQERADFVINWIKTHS